MGTKRSCFIVLGFKLEPNRLWKTGMWCQMLCLFKVFQTFGKEIVQMWFRESGKHLGTASRCGTGTYVGILHAVVVLIHFFLVWWSQAWGGFITVVNLAAKTALIAHLIYFILKKEKLMCESLLAINVCSSRDFQTC